MTTLEDLFLSTGMVGYLGPLALILIGYFISKKDKLLGVFYYMVECLIAAQYLALVEATPDYWWQIIILLLGGLLFCVYPLWDR